LPREAAGQRLGLPMPGAAVRGGNVVVVHGGPQRIAPPVALT
jgi:hypothetical protein